MSKPLITGQLILSDRGAIIPANEETGAMDPRHAVMMFGVIAAPKEIAKRYGGEKQWTQRLVTGADIMEEFLTLSINLEGYPLEAYYRNKGIDQLMCSPIWRA